MFVASSALELFVFVRSRYHAMRAPLDVADHRVRLTSLEHVKRFQIFRAQVPILGVEAEEAH